MAQGVPQSAWNSRSQEHCLCSLLAHPGCRTECTPRETTGEGPRPALADTVWCLAAATVTAWPREALRVSLPLLYPHQGRPSPESENMPEKTQGPRVLWDFCNGDLHYPRNILETRLQRRGQWAPLSCEGPAGAPWTMKRGPLKWPPASERKTLPQGARGASDLPPLQQNTVGHSKALPGP